MEVQQDFKELLALFNAHKVDYLIVGGYALAYFPHAAVEWRLLLIHVTPVPMESGSIRLIL